MGLIDMILRLAVIVKMAVVLSSVDSGVASAATYTAGDVLVILSDTADVADAADSDIPSNSGSAHQYAVAAAKGAAEVAGGAAAGAMAASTVGVVALKVAGFTAIGPAAGSYAAAWMSSIAVANGGGVAADSLYSVLQATAMGGVLLGAPVVLAAGVVVGAVVVVLKAAL